jgi:hypothetical protein
MKDLLYHKYSNSLIQGCDCNAQLSLSENGKTNRYSHREQKTSHPHVLTVQSGMAYKRKSDV